MCAQLMGYHNKLLRVNLSSNSATTEEIGESICRRYLGGAGFVAYYLWKELKPGIDPLGPENKLIFALGPITGMVLPGASRNCIGAKSPLTGGIAKAESGGFWMVELKRAGYDAIIFEGKAGKPVYLWVHDGEAEIRDAGHIWGKETKETQDIIRAELGDENIQVAMIGPGGENQVRFACIMEGCHDAAARGGLGAVMGSKNLKAVAARGHALPQVVNAEKIKEIRQVLVESVKGHPAGAFGTGGPDMLMIEQSGDLPIRNFNNGLFPEVKDIHAGVMKDTGIMTGMEGCFACPIRCKKIIKFEEPYRHDPAYGGPEYESIASLGSNCGVNDVKAICKGNERCGAYSLDTISTGSTIAFAMECFEKGLLTKKDTGGLELKFGNAEAMLEAIELINKREGIGDLLAEGTARLARKIGPGCKDFTLHVKGLEPGMHDPRIASGLAMTYMLSPTGADHCSGPPEPVLTIEGPFSGFHPLGFLKALSPDDLSPRKVAAWRMGQFENMLYDSMVLCHFPGVSFDQMVELLKATTGWDTGIPELLRIAERTLTVMRLFNIREGITAADDVMPVRFYQPKTDGVVANFKIKKAAYEEARKYYYVLMGWDTDGIPLPEKVAELDIA
jgi:aldehyde:ferredoxin oxidoreductase